MNSPVRPQSLLQTFDDNPVLMHIDPEGAPLAPAVVPPAKQGNDKPIGALLLDAGLIRIEDVERIIAYSRSHAMRFGDAAVALKLLKPDVLEQALAFQFEYPVLQPGSSLISREVVAAYPGKHAALDDLRALRNQLMLRWLLPEARDQRIVAVVSPGRAEGRSFLAANLAVTFSQLGQKTLLIDADMRHPRQHELFGIPSDAGLSSMLAQRTLLSGVQKIPGLKDLSVVPCGGPPPNPADLLARDVFGELLRSAAQAYEVVIVDTPAASESPEVELIAARAKGCVFVAREGWTSFDAARGLAQELVTLGASVVGTVLVSA